MNSLSSTQQTDNPLQLNYYKQKNRLVVVTPADEDRFSMTVDEAIHACRASIKNAAFRKQFKFY